MKAAFYLIFPISLLCSGCIHPPKPEQTATNVEGVERRIKSEFLTDNTVSRQFVKECADFWLSSKDLTHGGFYSFVDRTGKPIDSKKWLIGQSRLAFAFSKAFMLTGDTHYLTQAEFALDFLYRHGWDPQYGGWFEMNEADGTPLGRSANKWSFVQHYALLGPAAMCEATRSDEHCDWLDKGMDHANQTLWDNNAGGYFEFAEHDFSHPQDKGFTPTTDAITTHALAAYLLWQRPEHGQRLRDLGENITQHLMPTIDMEETTFGFVDNFHSDWTINPSVTQGSVGHVLKTAWALLRLYNLEGNPEHLAAAQKLLDHVLDDGGFDHSLGAPNSNYYWHRQDIALAKEYWQIEQGFTAGITGYYATQDPVRRQRYLDMADRSLQFFSKAMIDPIHGEIYSTADGHTGEITNAEKGGRWKSGYHSTETGYYAYLYGALLVNQQPATLYYKFDERPSARQYRLSPIALPDGHLRIDEVWLDGKRFEHFDPEQRTLSLPPATGGIFKVVFRNIHGTK